MRFWTTAEEKAIKELYADTPMSELTSILNREVGSIHGKARTLGIKRSASFRAGQHAGRFQKGSESGVSTRFKTGCKRYANEPTSDAVKSPE
ncbi:hypothetical protein PVE_R2G0495 [Pseudomonas veronii 1YdBTEX2]|uniref:Uncharacterized protein n=1 Tax=Pseudomonas veronii 1YdBTEX2 TaxID=1295141 RepID=A0A1D3K8L0_PSEVE|nr:hypothetical protein PVE_R2G0495 [Pseudomonas veronii 1YdBTEX2]